VNCYHAFDLAAPMAARKKSGIGQENGLGAIESHTQVKPCIVSKYNFLLIDQNGDNASDKSSLALNITLLHCINSTRRIVP